MIVAIIIWLVACAFLGFAIGAFIDMAESESEALPEVQPRKNRRQNHTHVLIKEKEPVKRPIPNRGEAISRGIGKHDFFLVILSALFIGISIHLLGLHAVKLQCFYPDGALTARMYQR